MNTDMNAQRHLLSVCPLSRESDGAIERSERESSAE
jgi:hypothetical protein